MLISRVFFFFTKSAADVLLLGAEIVIWNCDHSLYSGPKRFRVRVRDRCSERHLPFAQGLEVEYHEPSPPIMVPGRTWPPHSAYETWEQRRRGMLLKYAQ